MFNLPQELISLIYEYDCTKRSNFDKVLEEYNQRINKLKENYLEYNDEEIDNNEFQLENFEMEYFSFFKSYRMKIRENQDVILDEFITLRNQLEDEINQYYKNKAMDALVFENYEDHNKEFYETLLTRKINFDSINFGSKFIYWYFKGVLIRI